MARCKKKTKVEVKKEENEEESELCSKCGSKLVEEGGKMICPNCDATIDYFGEDEE